MAVCPRNVRDRFSGAHIPQNQVGLFIFRIFRYYLRPPAVVGKHSLPVWAEGHRKGRGAQDITFAKASNHGTGCKIPQNDGLIFSNGHPGLSIRTDIHIQHYPAWIVALQVVDDFPGVQIPVGGFPGFCPGKRSLAIWADSDGHDDTKAIANEAAYGAWLVRRF